MSDDISSSGSNPAATPGPEAGSETVQVWDLAVRAMHWGVAALFVVTFLTEDLQTLHQLAGYTILALAGVRIVWGFIGSKHARFGDFLRPPGEAIGYIRGLINGTAPRTLGHNAAGGWMIIALLMGLIASAVTGWLLTRQPGAPAEWLIDMHELAANATLALVVIHLAGVAISSWRHRENLVKAMLTGRKARNPEPATRD